MKKNSIMVKSMFMNILAAGVFGFGFASCSDDLNELSNVGLEADSQEIVANENDPLKTPIGLVYEDFITPGDVQILNADTTEISISKALADKKGIDNFVQHPMGIWQSFEERPYLRRAISQKLVGDRYILKVVRSGLGEVLGEDVELNTSLYVNPNAATTRGADGSTDKYTDANNVIHPVAVTLASVVNSDGTVTRGAGGAGLCTLSAEDILNGARFNVPGTRSIIGDAKRIIKDAVDFIDNVRKNGMTINGDGQSEILHLEGEIEPNPIKVKVGDEDTLNIYPKIPYDISLDYTLKLRSNVKVKGVTELAKDIVHGNFSPIGFNLNYFEGRLDGNLAVSPEVTLGFGGKLELPKDKQDIKITDLHEVWFEFMAGCIPVIIVVQPSLNLHFEAGVEGRIYTGFKYEYASEFSAGVKRENGKWDGISDYKTTKSKFSFITPRGTVSAKAAAGVLLKCNVLVDGVLGPTASVGPLLKADMSATFAPFEKNPFTFDADVKCGLYGKAGVTLKLWKIDLCEWNNDLHFGPEWNIWSYKWDGKNTSREGSNSQLDKQVEDMKQKAVEMRLEKLSGLEKEMFEWENITKKSLPEQWRKNIEWGAGWTSMRDEMKPYVDEDRDLVIYLLEKLMYEQVLENNGKLSNSSAEDDMNRVIREYNRIKH